MYWYSQKKPATFWFIVFCAFMLVLAAVLVGSRRDAADLDATSSVSVIVLADSVMDAAQAARDVGADITHELGIIDAVAVQLSAANLSALESHPFVNAIHADLAVRTSSDLLVYRDSFDSGDYAGQDGTALWNSDWIEVNDDEDASSGDVRVKNGALQLKDGRKAARRVADLSSAESASLTIVAFHDSLDDDDEFVTIKVSPDNGDSWMLIDTITQDSADQPTAITYSLDQFVGSEIILRFVTSADVDSKDRVYIEEVTIEANQSQPGAEEPEGPSEESEASSVTKWIKADQLHAAGITGDGVTVAIVDTGFLARPELVFDLNGDVRVIAQYDAIADKAIKFPRDNSFDDVVEDDEHGHGGHIASTISNSSNDASGNALGVAPDVDLIIVKAFSAEGSGSYADVIRGIEKILEYKDTLNIRVLNLSFYSAPQSNYWEDPLNLAVMRAWEAGIVVVTGAGNAGPDALTIGVPANTPYVITVGALTDNYTPNDTTDDYVPPFSSAGPSFEGFIKPEIVAPGGHVVGLVGPDTTIGREYSQFGIGDDYFSLSGTSMSAAVTSGVVALMLQDDPDLSPDDVKCRLIDSATVALAADESLAFPILQQGAGLIDALAAVESDASGCANGGLDVSAEFETDTHYVGPVTTNEAGEYVILDSDGNENLAWDGRYSESSGNYLWSGGNYLWSGGNYLWSGGNYLWSGGNYLWSGGNYLWSGGNYLWSGGNYLWSGSETASPLSSSSVITIVEPDK